MARDKRENERSMGVSIPTSLRKASDDGYGRKSSQIAISTKDGIIVNGFRLSRYGAFWGDVVPTVDEWKATLAVAFDFNEGIQWVFGDLIAFCLNLGYGQIGKAVSEIAEQYEYSPTTLNIYASVCRTYQDENFRRLKNLSFSHYQEAMVIDDEIARTETLIRASEEKWSTRKLREYIKDDPPALLDSTPPSVQRMKSIFANNRKKYDKIVPKAKKEGSEATGQLSRMIDDEVAYLMAMKTMLDSD